MKVLILKSNSIMSKECIDNLLIQLRNDIENTGMMILPPDFTFEVVDFDFVTTKDIYDKYVVRHILS